MDFNFDFEREERRKKLKIYVFRLLRWVIEITAVVVIAYVLIVYMVEQTSVQGDSMNVTLNDGDNIIINKLAFAKKDPERYDVIVFKQSEMEHSFYNIKRVIGLPGETILIEDGEIYINGEMLLEPIKVEPILLGGFASEPLTLDEDEFFVLGDNRNQSEDSRFATIGNVTRDDIIGLAWIRINKFSFVNKSNKNYVRPKPTSVLSTTPTPTET